MIQIPAFAGLSLAAKLWSAAGALAAIVLIGWGIHAKIFNDGYRAGYSRALGDVEAADKGAIDASNHGRARVHACFVSGGVWDTARGACQR